VLIFGSSASRKSSEDIIGAATLTTFCFVEAQPANIVAETKAAKIILRDIFIKTVTLLFFYFDLLTLSRVQPSVNFSLAPPGVNCALLSPSVPLPSFIVPSAFRPSQGFLFAVAAPLNIFSTWLMTKVEKLTALACDLAFLMAGGIKKIKVIDSE